MKRMRKNASPHREPGRFLSSMVRRALPIGLLGVSVAAVAASLAPYGLQLGMPQAGGAVAQSPATLIGSAIDRWRQLRQTDAFSFADYANFLLDYPGWPGEEAMRRTAERRLIAAGGSATTVIRFFDRYPPLSAGAHMRYADALLSTGRRPDAVIAAQAAWTRGALGPEDETRLFALFGSEFTPAMNDLRMDRLLWDRATAAAARQMMRVTPQNAAVFAARLALQQRTAGAEGPSFPRDAGWLVDRARWLRDAGRGPEARAMLSRVGPLDRPPLDAGQWLDTLLLFARGAANDNQSSIALDIARHADKAFPIGTIVRDRPLGERDDYTSLVWLGGSTALEKLGRPGDAALMFNRYAAAAKTPQTQTKGLYWAGRAALAGGDATTANRYFTQAAAHPDQFYGQLASERLGQPVAVPQPAAVPITPEQRASFLGSSVVLAARALGQQNLWSDQSLFLRTIAANADTPVDHALAIELASAIRRPDLGVMVARSARNSGVADFVPAGFPEVPVPPVQQRLWVMIHAIARQESQFDRQAVSHAGARGLMQLMPGTAREVAGQLGLPYDYERLTSDPSYNIMLGSSFFDRMLNYYGGNHVLAVASYNAGPGNVNKWLRANGDPRTPGVDVLQWIEKIPLSETRGYVQRVLENAVVYDAMNPQYARMPHINRLSAYLGKRTPG